MRLPWITEFVLAVGNRPVPLFVAPAAILLIGLFVVWIVSRVSDAGRRVWVRLVYAVPLVGTLIRSSRMAAFADLLAVLVEYELPLPEAFRLAGAASSDPLMAHQGNEIENRLAQGAALSVALRGRGLLPEWVAWMAGAGEQRGALAPTLRQIATLYRRQVESRAALLRTVLPAFMIIATAGAMTALFAFTVMLPMVKLMEGLMR
jgi:type II secretory pathway component PulF